MNKIEYMAMSLPYGLKVLRGDNITILKVSGADIDCNSVLFTEKNTTTYGNISHSKPILRPVSDLIAEINHKNEVFVPLYKLVDPENTEWSKMAAIEYNPFPKIPNYLPYYRVHHDTLGEIISVNPRNILVLPFHLVCKLVEWHFDICGLIEKGEAVNYHTLSDFIF